MRVVAFIPIKLNNQRLPGKTFLPLGEKPVCQHLFDTLKRVDLVDECYAFCSDEKIIPHLPSHIKFLKRSADLDDYTVKGLEIIDSFVNTIDADIYVLTHITAPFLKASSLSLGIEKVMSGEYDSSFSVICHQDYCWYQGKPINYDMKNIPTTQNLEPIYMETGSFFIFTKEVFTKLHQRIGIRPFMHVIDSFEGIELDTSEDYKFAQVVANYLEKCHEEC